MHSTNNTYPTRNTFQKSDALLSLEDNEITMPFEIHTIEWMIKNRWSTGDLPNRNSYFEIIWILKGSGEILIDLEKYHINNHGVYCIAPGQVHVVNADTHLIGYSISFSMDFICGTEDNYDLLFKSGLFNPLSSSSIVKVNDENVEEMKEIAEMMTKEFSNYFLLRSEILRGYLKIFLIYLTRQQIILQSSANSNKNSNLVKKFLSLLDKNYTTKKMVADYAEELCITPNYLNEIVKKISGKPVSEHIKQRIILEAKRQASYTHASMKEIAYNLGFNDTAHFSKFFKNACGVNFTNYKNELAMS